MNHPPLRAAILRGLLALASHADAGGPDDMGLHPADREARRTWADIQRAIDWIRKKRDAVEDDARRRRG